MSSPKVSRLSTGHARLPLIVPTTPPNQGDFASPPYPDEFQIISEHGRPTIRVVHRGPDFEALLDEIKRLLPDFASDSAFLQKLTDSSITVRTSYSSDAAKGILLELGDALRAFAKNTESGDLSIQKVHVSLTYPLDLRQYRPVRHEYSGDKKSTKGLTKLAGLVLPIPSTNAVTRIERSFDELRELQESITSQLQVYLHGVEGVELPTLAAKRAFVDELKGVLERLHRLVECPVCRSPAILACSPTSKAGQLQFQHRVARGETKTGKPRRNGGQHGGGSVIPPLRLIPPPQELKHPK